jgi:hypothetical protein
MQYYSLIDILFLPIYLVIVLITANMHAKRMIPLNPAYKYYMRGLVAKICGGFGLAFVYTVYYPGGDTTQYFLDSLAFQKLIFVNFKSFWHVFTNKAEISNYYYFNSETGYPAYCRDPKAWFVVKIALFIVGLSFQSYLVSTLLCATFSFIGIWKLYRIFADEFPSLHKEMALAFLFIPSVFFWGSGLMKDTFTLAALGFFVSGFYRVFIKGDSKFFGFITLLLAGYTILAIKPYILVGLLPASIVWIIHRLVGKIQGSFLKSATVPILVFLGLGVGYGFMALLGDALAEYKLETILEKAVINQRDLKSDYHKGNAFDIGEFDSTLPSILGKFPIATFSAIYRPMIIESNNIVMFISGLENLVILLFSLKVLYMVRVFSLFKYVFRNHLLTFSFVFSLLFAYSVGLTTSNFGSLVRYKIPCIPFFIASLYLIQHLCREQRAKDEASFKQVVDPASFLK